MYEINLSTLLLIGLDDKSTKVVTREEEFIVNCNVKDIINNSCRFFGSSLQERVNTTKRLINVASKSPIIVEESREIIFFPLKSVREKVNIWISFNNLEKYIKDDNKTLLKFRENKEIIIDFSYYIIDNQVTRSMMLDYVLKKRKESL
ncbi:MAG: competence protein ComK [Bacilli bacterium]|nr:competence protein ComK [Bacilli bacterium]